MSVKEVQQSLNLANPDKKEVKKHWFRKTSIVLGGLATSLVVTVGGAGAAITGSVAPPPESPVVRIVNPENDPQTELGWQNNNGISLLTVDVQAEEKNSQLEQDCLNSDFISIDTSGTSMETSNYAAAQKYEMTKKLGGCSMYMWYGQTYNEGANATAVKDAVEKYTRPGEVKKVILRGASFGGIAAEAIAAHATIKNSNTMRVVGIFMEDTPHDAGGVNYNLLGLSFNDVSKAVDFGNMPDILARNHALVALGAIKGQIDMGKFWDQEEWQRTWDNVSKTWPPLMWDEIAGIQRGMVNYDPSVPVRIIDSVKDDSINMAQSSEKIKNKIPDTKVISVSYDGLASQHAPGWLSEAQPFSQSVYEQETIALLDAANG